jgi:hypothetical protein
MAVQFHFVVKFEVPFLDSFLDPHPEDPAVVDGVRIPVMEATVTFLLYSIGPKHSDEDINPDTGTVLPTTPAEEPPGPLTRARARELNFVMILKNEGPEGC